MDVVAAFLNPPIHYLEMYMSLRQGREWLKPDIDWSNTVCRLQKALYGLTRSPKLWYNHIATFFRSIGFHLSAYDAALYTQKDQTELIHTLLYVDDRLVTSSNRDPIDRTKALISNRFKMKDLGADQCFINLQIDRQPNCEIRLGQSQYIDKILEKFGMSTCNGVETPMQTNRASKTETTTAITSEYAQYQSLIGNIVYLMTSTCPDLAYTLSALSQCTKAPRDTDLQAAKRVLRYIKKTQNLALTYLSTAGPLTGYTDPGWAGDAGDCKSTSEYVFNLQGAAISWKSKKQTFVALSSMEAEYIGCSEAAREAVWIRRLYRDPTS